MEYKTVDISFDELYEDVLFKRAYTKENTLILPPEPEVATSDFSKLADVLFKAAFRYFSISRWLATFAMGFIMEHFK